MNRATRRRVPGSLATASGRNTPWTWKGAGWCRASSWTTGSSILAVTAVAVAVVAVVAVAVKAVAVVVVVVVAVLVE